MEINLKEDHAEVLRPGLMKDFVEDQHPIHNIPPLNEGGLVGVGNVIGQPGRPIGVPFGQDPENHVDNRDWAELADVGGPRNFGDERDDPIVKASKVDGANVEPIEDGHDPRFNHIPEGLEELNREAIQTRRR